MERERNNPVGEDESSELLKGEDIDRFYTIGSYNNNETIGVVANKKNFRLRVGELNKIKDLIHFKIDLASDSNDGRRTNNYLEIVEHLKEDFIAFLNSDIHSKKVLLQNFKWQWVSKDGKTVNQTGWSHHRILKTYQLVYILQTLKVIVNQNQSFEANAKKIYQESKNFVEFVSKFVECFRGEPRIFGAPKLTSQKCFKRYLLFFRWVVGLDPDLHLWTFIPHNDLLPPVDVTVKRVLKRVGVFDREYGCKWADVLRYSDFLKLVSPQNKLWADLYLSRLGIMGICNSKKIDSKCDICPFQRFCAY